MSYSSVVAADTPTAWWRLGESAGAASAADSSGNSLTATYSGTVTRGSTGLLTSDTDLAAAFTSGKATTAASAFLNGSVHAMTLEAWINSSTTAVSLGIICSDTGTTTGRWFQFKINTGGFLQLILFNAGGTINTTFTDTTNICDGVTHHVAAVISGTNVSLYVDGVLKVGPTAFTYAPTTLNRSVAIGNQITGVTAQPFVGTIDEPAIYMSALTGTQIQTHYTAGLAEVATITSETAVLSTESINYVEASTIASKTAISATEIHTGGGSVYTDSSTITSKTSVTPNDLESYHETQTVVGITTPAVTVELQTGIRIINEGSSTTIGSIVTMLVEIDVPGQTIGSGTSGSGNVVGGTDTEGGTFVAPSGYWGASFDDDNGIIP